MNQKNKLRYCLIGNLSVFLFFLFIVCLFHEKDNSYMKIGPNENLYVLSIKINTYKKYFLLQLFLFFIEVSRVIISDMANPILGFTIFNPDKKEITDFTKNELQFLGNSMWLIDSLSRTLFVMVTISQIDIAILRVIYSEFTTIFTIRILLNEKEFIQKKNYEIDLEMQPFI